METTEKEIIETVRMMTSRWLLKYLCCKNLSEVTISRVGRRNVIRFNCDQFTFESKDAEARIKYIVMYKPGQFELETTARVY
jgi:hypothetical protein